MTVDDWGLVPYREAWASSDSVTPLSPTPRPASA